MASGHPSQPLWKPTPEHIENTNMYRFYETIEEVFSDMDKVIIYKACNSVVPYLPLPELKKKCQQ